MPHVAHLCVGHWCRFHLATYVNGHIVSTVGEYLPDRDCRRHMLEWEFKSPFSRKKREEAEKVLSQEGDAFDRYYLHFFGYEEIGCNRKYETMVFAAEKRDEECCPYDALVEFCVDSMGYNCPGEATRGHYAICDKFDNVETIKRKYIKNTVTIKAYQWFPGMKTNDVQICEEGKINTFDGLPYVFTCQGIMNVAPGDYIAENQEGQKFVYRPDIFEQNYNEVDDE